MIHTPENNQMEPELDLLKDSLDEDYLTSCGFVLTTDAKSSITELLSRADEALYKVKRSAKGRYVEYTG